MSNQAGATSRRTALKALGALGTAAAVGSTTNAATSESSQVGAGAAGFRDELQRHIQSTPLIDTHEHLPDEDERLRGQFVPCDDWGVLFSHYIDSDLIAAGMTETDRNQLAGKNIDPIAKWKLLEPFWPAVKNTGYGRAVRIVIQELYGIDELDDQAIPRLQAGYESVRRPGFYRKILVELANIESSQNNYLWKPYKESRQPTLLMQDLSIMGMHMGPDLNTLSQAAGKNVRTLSDWHEVIAWWFQKYGPYATAVKTQAAYARGLDFEQIPAEKAEGAFKKILQKDPITPEERKLVEDHLFWYAVEQATQHHLPVKLHTGYYAGQNGMPLGRVAGNPAQAAELCRKSRNTQWIFMHIAYPYWQDLIAVAKHYTNAHIDMCWSWIIDPFASTQFLKSCLMAAPANKVLVFGGDYIPVECVLGHARIARQGILRALSELTDEGYLSRKDAMELVEMIMRGNAWRIFQVEKKAQRLRGAPWA
ncbi:MAG: amidohydrolase family protein [Bacillota bacterium]